MLRTDARTGWYTPTKALTRFLTAWREGHAAGPITVDLLICVQTPPSVAPRALRTLEGLGLVLDRGQPSETLQRYRSASTDDEAREVLAGVIRREYADVLTQVGDPATASETELLDAFQRYEPASQRDRMVGLFLGLCKFSGMVEEARRTGRPPRSADRSAAGGSTGTRRRTQSETRVVHLRSGPTVTLQVAGGLLGSSPDDLAFVFDLVRRINEYESATRSMTT